MKASELILDLLRTYGARGTTVQDIAEAGALFGITGNAVRVNLTRLVSKGIIESMQRGEYRICDGGMAVNHFAEAWRLGEERLQRWDAKSWLCIHTLDKAQKSIWALENHGFRRISEGLWIRPSNLKLPAFELIERLQSMGLSENAILMKDAQLLEQHQTQWIKQFDVADLTANYQIMTEKLNQSLKRLPQLPLDTAKKESFTLGGRGIELLAKDPLIPSMWLDAEHRKQLWQILLAYDRAGRTVWAGSSRREPDALVTPNSKLMSN